MDNEELSHGEVIIVKRGGAGHDDEHHGGVWKIAFADFMTAMMAFFLVMWLINASNEKTKKAVASYFNPIKLMDTSSTPKGVRNPEHKVTQESKLDEAPNGEISSGGESSKTVTVSGDDDQKLTDQALFVDPYAVLSEIAAGIPEIENDEQKVGDVENRLGERIGLSNGASFQDPFDPTSWSKQVGLPKDPMQETSPIDRMSVEDEVVENYSYIEDVGTMQSSDAEILKIEEVELKPQEAENTGNKEDEKGVSEFDTAEQKTEEDENYPSKDSEKLAEEIRKKITSTIDEKYLSELDLEIVANDQGAAVVLSDKKANGMFNIGSARPTSELVRAMEQIGAVIADHPGMIEISGHTDGRQYQSADYDNWRLSSARAQMAYYMLIRGGMKELQVERIVGQAAVNLRIPEEPFAAANRRIEVLLKLAAS